VTTKKRRVVNMNYPPEDMPMEEIERFWGEVSPEEDRKFAEELKKIKPKKGIRKPKPRML
jgi:hypothetical protein